MTSTRPTADQFPNELWEYLPNGTDPGHQVFSRMPSRADRDRLVAEAENDPDALQRVQLWNYFFRIDEEDVGEDQRRSMEALRQDLRDLRGAGGTEIERHEREIETLRQQISSLDRGLIGRRQEIQRDHERRMSRAKNGGRVLRGFGVGLLSVGGFFGLLMFDALVNGSEGWGGCFAALAFPAGFLGFVLSAIARARVRKLSPPDPEAEIRDAEAKARARQAQAHRRIEEIRHEIEARREAMSSHSREIEEGIQALRDQIALLSHQVPRQRPASPDETFQEACLRIPEDEEVAAWLVEDIAELKHRAQSETGMTGRLGDPILRSSEKDEELANIFCIPGPAEIQESRLVPNSYISNPGSDRAKHLSARRYARLPDGQWADFHGVYNIQFVIVADDILASYRTTWDFIDGRRRGEEARSQHYADVVGVQDYRGSRELKHLRGGSGATFLDNAPTLQLSLTSSERLQVTWVNDEYFALTDAPREIDGNALLLNPAAEAVNAIKAVRQRVDAAKRKREWRASGPGLGAR